MVSSLKVALLVAVGPLDRYGYQYSYLPVLENLSAFATRIYMTSSTRSRVGIDEVLERFPNIVYKSDESTWFSLDENGNEHFSLSPLEANSNAMLDLARSDGMDCASIFSINHYLPEENQQAFINDCQNLLESGQPFHWLYKRIQLAHQLFEVDRRVPWVINLHYPEKLKIISDTLYFPESGRSYRSTLGEFQDKNFISSVDVPREMTRQDLEEMRCFIRNYDETNPGVDPTFVWERDGWREVKKYSAKQFSPDPLSPTGQIIAQNSRPDFVSQLLLKAHPENAPWHVKIGRSMKSRLDTPSLRQNIVQQLKRIKRKMIGKNSE